MKKCALSLPNRNHKAESNYKFEIFFGGGGTIESDDSAARRWEDEEAREFQKAKFHDDTSEESSMCSNDEEDDEQKRLMKRKQKALLDVKREITYSAYVDNIENTVKMLTASKLVKLNEDARKKIFVTSQATRREHFEFFGKRKAIIY